MLKIGINGVANPKKNWEKKKKKISFLLFGLL
jgi:hypothetical protein